MRVSAFLRLSKVFRVGGRLLMGSNFDGFSPVVSACQCFLVLFSACQCFLRVVKGFYLQRGDAEGERLLIVISLVDLFIGTSCQ